MSYKPHESCFVKTAVQNIPRCQNGGRQKDCGAFLWRYLSVFVVWIRGKSIFLYERGLTSSFKKILLQDINSCQYNKYEAWAIPCILIYIPSPSPPYKEVFKKFERTTEARFPYSPIHWLHIQLLFKENKSQKIWCQGGGRKNYRTARHDFL